MCGIVALKVKHELVEHYQPLFDAAVKTIAYRGQDQQHQLMLNLDRQHKLLVAHARLHISGSKEVVQPLYDMRANAGVVFNGELYELDHLVNHWIDASSLRQDDFGNYQEAEVLLELVKQRWAEREEWMWALDGMFAIVAWNNGEVVAMQDRWQIKPLYSIPLQDGAGTLWCSQPPYPICPATNEQLAHYLIYRYPASHQTKETNNPLLEPSSVVNPHTKGIHPPWAEPTYDLKTLKEHFNTMLPYRGSDYQEIGIMFSGGVDSTLLAAVGKEQNLLSVHTPLLTARDTNEPASLDTQYARQAADRLGLNLTYVDVGPELLLRLPELMAVCEYPVADVSGLLTVAICDQAKASGIKILWSGAGADELFAGYRRHEVFQRYISKSFTGGLVGKALSKGGGYGLVAALASKLRFAEESFPRELVARFSQAKVFRQLDFAAVLRMQMTWPPELWLTSKVLNPEPCPTLQTLVEHDKQHYLPYQVLMLADRASMLSQVEIRVPFLDSPSLSNFLDCWVADLHIKHGPKWLLKSMLAEYMGKEFVNRPKTGFGVNLNAWIRSPIAQEMVQQALASESRLWSVLDRKGVQKMAKAHFDQNANVGLNLYAVLCWILWEQAHPIPSIKYY